MISSHETNFPHYTTIHKWLILVRLDLNGGFLWVVLLLLARAEDKFLWRLMLLLICTLNMGISPFSLSIFQYFGGFCWEVTTFDGSIGIYHYFRNWWKLFDGIYSDFFNIWIISDWIRQRSMVPLYLLCPPLSFSSTFIQIGRVEKCCIWHDGFWWILIGFDNFTTSYLWRHSIPRAQSLRTTIAALKHFFDRKRRPAETTNNFDFEMFYPHSSYYLFYNNSNVIPSIRLELGTPTR